MSERDRSGRVDGRNVPLQRQPPRQASLHEALAATAEQAAERAKTVVGSSAPRRIAGFMRELISVQDALARKWGVNPREISMQGRIIRQREQLLDMEVIYKPRKSSTDRTPVREQLLDTEVIYKPRKSSTDRTPVGITEEDRIRIRKLIPFLSREAELLLSRPSMGKAISYLLADKNMSQEFLAGLIGLSKSTVDKATRGVRTLKLNIIHDICDALQIPEDDDRRQVLVKMAIEEERKRKRLKDQQKLNT